MSLAVSLTKLKGVGPRVAERLERLGLHCVEDLLFHLPYKYQDRTRIMPIGSLRPGEEVVIEGEIEASDIKFGKRRSLLCRISDGSGSLLLRFFIFLPNSSLHCSGVSVCVVMARFGVARPCWRWCTLSIAKSVKRVSLPLRSI